jgi:hypothetical protein
MPATRKCGHAADTALGLHGVVLAGFALGTGEVTR